MVLPPKKRGLGDLHGTPVADLDASDDATLAGREGDVRVRIRWWALCAGVYQRYLAYYPPPLIIRVHKLRGGLLSPSGASKNSDLPKCPPKIFARLRRALIVTLTVFFQRRRRSFVFRRYTIHLAVPNRCVSGTFRFAKDRAIGRRFVELISQRIERAAGEKNKKLHLQVTISVKKIAAARRFSPNFPTRAFGARASLSSYGTPLYPPPPPPLAPR